MRKEDEPRPREEGGLNRTEPKLTSFPIFFFWALITRFLLAKLNPSVTYASGGQVMGAEAIRTDDVSMETFLEHLGRLVAAHKK